VTEQEITNPQLITQRVTDFFLRNGFKAMLSHETKQISAFRKAAEATGREWGNVHYFQFSGNHGKFRVSLFWERDGKTGRVEARVIGSCVPGCSGPVRPSEPQVCTFQQFETLVMSAGAKGLQQYLDLLGHNHIQTGVQGRRPIPYHKHLN
jgi:hypothetical protein